VNCALMIAFGRALRTNSTAKNKMEVRRKDGQNNALSFKKKRTGRAANKEEEEEEEKEEESVNLPLHGVLGAALDKQR
jgi:hypothetical protein